MRFSLDIEEFWEFVSRFELLSIICGINLEAAHPVFDPVAFPQNYDPKIDIENTIFLKLPLKFFYMMFLKTFCLDFQTF